MDIFLERWTGFNRFLYDFFNWKTVASTRFIIHKMFLLTWHRNQFAFIEQLFGEEIL